MATRKELTAAITERYRSSDRVEKARILDEFVTITGFHRKHAMRVLRNPVAAPAGRRSRRRRYDEAERNAIVLLWEAADRVCSKRLKALLPVLIDAMERHGHINLAPEILREAADDERSDDRPRPPADSRARRTAATATGGERAALQYPNTHVRRLERTCPGVRRGRPRRSQRSDVARQLRSDVVLTDVATGWTECAPLLVRERTLLSAVLTELRKQPLFALLGLDTDNDSVFMNETLKAYCDTPTLSSFAAAVPKERPGVGRAEERRRGAADGRLSPVRRARGCRSSGRALPLVPPVRELLPAVVQASPISRWLTRGRRQLGRPPKALSGAYRSCILSFRWRAP